MLTLCKFALLWIAFLHVFKIVIPVNDVLLGVSTLVLFCVGLSQQKKAFRSVTLLFFTAGVGILALYRLPLAIWIQSLDSMTNIIAIILVMQLFSIPIDIGKYGDTVEFWLKKLFKKESSLYLFAMLATNLFSSFLLFGTVPVMVSLFNKALKNNLQEHRRFFATAIMRGYAMVLFWAPGAVIMLLVMHVTNVAWSQLFLPGLLLSLIGLASAYLLEHFTRLNRPIISTSDIPSSALISLKEASLKTLHIFGVVLALLVFIAVFETFSIGSSASRILLAGLFVAAIWILSYRSHEKFHGTLRAYWHNGITQATDFSVFFIAVGLFAGAIDHSGLLTHVQPWLQAGADRLGYFSILVIPLIFITIAVLGIHPLVLAVMLGKILLAVSLPLSHVSIALILILSSSISFIVSPFAGMSLMTAKFLQVSPMDVSLRWNLVFSLIFLVEGLLFAFWWPW